MVRYVNLSQHPDRKKTNFFEDSPKLIAKKADLMDEMQITVKTIGFPFGIDGRIKKPKF